MNRIEFVLEKIETKDTNTVRAWEGVVERIFGKAAPACQGLVCPEAVLTLRADSDLPKLGLAILAAEERHFSYRLVVITKDGFEWTRKP
jgi:hypothetical protein